MVSKYDDLGTYLRHQLVERVPMTFAEIERVTGTSLPAKSQHSRAWWSNNPSNNVMTKVWLDAGFETAEVQMKARTVVFVRKTMPEWREASVERSAGLADEAMEYVALDRETAPTRHPAWGAMKGTFTIAPGYDLTAPVYSAEEWAEIEKEMEEDWDQIEQGMTGGKK
jgi:hypothetical protein